MSYMCTRRQSCSKFDRSGTNSCNICSNKRYYCLSQKRTSTIATTTSFMATENIVLKFSIVSAIGFSFLRLIIFSSSFSALFISFIFFFSSSLSSSASLASSFPYKKYSPHKTESRVAMACEKKISRGMWIAFAKGTTSIDPSPEINEKYFLVLIVLCTNLNFFFPWE